MNTSFPNAPTGDRRIEYLQRRLLESFDQLWDDFVDSSDAMYDIDGTRWTQVGGNGTHETRSAAAIDAQQLAAIRSQCRRLAVENEFAINGHESYVRKPTSFHKAGRVRAGCR